MKLYKKLDNFVQCLACSHSCHIAVGKIGLCGVRRNDDGVLNLLVYGKPCVVHVDPIEKKPLYHFLPGTEILSLGTFGCNFHCGFCQNWDISQMTKDKEKINLNYFSPEDIVAIAQKNKILSIAYTYNEPTIWTEYAIDIAKKAKAEGIKNVFVSNGYMTEDNARYLSKYLDAINIDLKSFSDRFYQTNCGARLSPVLNNIRQFWNNGVWVEVTTLLIPGENDSDDELKQIAEFLVSVSPDIPWHLSAFHPDYKMTNKPATLLDILLKAYEIGRKAGLKYVYVGNVEGEDFSQTYCPNCREVLIKREWMKLVENKLINGACPKCEEKIKGVWK